MEYAVKIENIQKNFKENIALNHVSVSFEKGKIHGIIGRNGSGKTVMLKCVCGLMHQDTGTITVNGRVVGKDIDIPEKVGMIIEAPGFLPNYSGYKNLKFLADINRKADKLKVKNTMLAVGLDPSSKKHVGKYSLGMRQRLGIAQAIMEDPELLILDEPMNGLDNHGVEDIRNLLLEFKNKGKTIIIASHNREDIAVLCDTVCEMDAGKLTVIK